MTIQYLAEHFYGVGTDTLVALHSSDLAGADTMFMNQSVLSNAFFAHGFPKAMIRNHAHILPINSQPSLDILTDIGI